MVNTDIEKDLPEGQQFCQDKGFDRLYEPRTSEDSQFTVRLEFCEYISDENLKSLKALSIWT